MGGERRKRSGLVSLIEFVSYARRPSQRKKEKCECCCWRACLSL